MTMLEVIPQEFFDARAVPPAVTLDGELLGALDEAPPGVWLAEMLEAVDRTKLTTFELPAYLRMCSRMQAWAAAQLAAGVAELASRPDAVGPDKDIALALQEPVGAAQRRLWWSKRLRRMLPGVWRRMAAGDLSERHVVRLVEVTGTVNDPELMAKIEERVLPAVGKKTADELARVARDALKRLDPTGVQRRAKAARAEADVEFYPDPDGEGMGDVVIHAPIEDATIIKTAVDAYAASAKAGGDPRPIGVLRAEAPARWASHYLTGTSSDRRSAPTAGGRPIEIVITLPLRTALGLDDLPGEVPGLGIVPRSVIADMIRQELPKLRLLVIDPDDGRLVYRAHTGYRPTPDQVAQVRATYVFSVGPGSKILAARCDTDHAIPHPVGPTVIGNLLSYDRPWHIGKTRGELSVTVDDNGHVYMTTVSGQTRTVTPYDYRMSSQRPAVGEDVAVRRGSLADERKNERL
jgi:hypothetical protein